MNPHRASQEYLAARIDSADPLRRVVLLHEGAARFTREAIRHIERREFDQAHRAFVRAKQIILHFLSSIPESDDSELAAHLRGLFTYTYSQLVEGNLRKDPRPTEAALQVIRTLGDGWAELDKQHRQAGRTPPSGEATYLV